MPTTRRPGARPASARSSTTSSARLCGTGNRASISGSTPASRSVRPENASFASAAAGRAAMTVSPRSRARRTASCHTVVLPMPGSPTIASARNPGSASSRNPSTTSSSASRPTRSGTFGAYATDARSNASSRSRIRHVRARAWAQKSPISKLGKRPPVLRCHRGNSSHGCLSRLEAKTYDDQTMVAWLRRRQPLVHVHTETGLERTVGGRWAPPRAGTDDPSRRDTAHVGEDQFRSASLLLVPAPRERTADVAAPLASGDSGPWLPRDHGEATHPGRYWR